MGFTPVTRSRQGQIKYQLIQPFLSSFLLILVSWYITSTLLYSHLGLRYITIRKVVFCRIAHCRGKFVRWKREPWPGVSNHVTFIQIRPAQFFFSKTIIVFDARRLQLWQGWTNRAKSRLQINMNTSLYIYIEWRPPGWLCVTLQTDWITQYSSLDRASI